MNTYNTILYQLRKRLPVATDTLDYANIKMYVHSWVDKIRTRSSLKEPETIRWLENNIKKDSVYFDVGANVGAYALVAAHLGAQVFAFEPIYSTFSSLCQNIALNNFEDKITPFLIALGEKNAVIPITLSSAVSGAALHKVGEKSGTFVSVPVFKLDTLISELKLPLPSLLKIDVDGYETQVLDGATETLRSVTHILIENDYTKNGTEVEQKIIQSGFALIEKYPRGKGRSETLFNCVFQKV